MGDKGEMGQSRAGRDHLCAGDADAGIGLLGHMRVNVARASRGARSHVAVDRRLHDRVIDEWHPLLTKAIPAARVLLIRRVKLRISAERGEERCLVIR